jgi:hypothetical protein
MRGPINVKPLNNITNWQMRFNSSFKGLNTANLILSYAAERARLDDETGLKELFADECPNYLQISKKYFRVSKGILKSH